ncbi:hypothetical protein TI39_contig278g00071 [Zymoseptoria brevis]|uniref:Uncharacterized protein n=1 Tax=Zymoseptoria brevis TaxID=1047168 RepID=A0A0F4GWT3_9PEZI|nr:hypothetical protein TI39_contig278g00071 [Zymoseptoria brevis]
MHDREDMGIKTGKSKPSPPATLETLEKQRIQNEICNAIDGIRVLPPGKTLAVRPTIYDQEQFLPLRTALSKWTQVKLDEPSIIEPDDPDWPRELIYRLDLPCTEASISVAQLQGACVARAEILEYFGRQQGFTVLLATMERRENIIQLKKVFYPSGTFLVSIAPVRVADILQPGTVSGDFKRPHGVVLVLVRDDMLTAFLTRSLRATDLHRSEEFWDASARSLISALNLNLFERPGVVFVEEVLRDVCTYILQVNLAQKAETEQKMKDGEPQAQMSYSTDNLLAQVVYIGCAYEDATLVGNAVTCTRDRLQDDVIQQIRETTLAADAAKQEAFFQILRRAVEPYDTFSERHRLLCSIQAIGDWIEAPETWALESLAEVLESATTVDEDDGFTLYELLGDYHMEEVVQQRILPAAQRLASTHGRFVVALLGSICNEDSVVGEELRKVLFTRLHVSASLDISKTFNERAPGATNSDSDPYPEAVGSESGMANLLVATVMYGLRLQSPEITATMLHQLAKAVEAVPPAQLTILYMPFVRELLSTYDELDGEEDEDLKMLWSKIITSTIEQLIVRFVGKQPPAHGEDDVWIDRAGSLSVELRGLQQDIIERVLGEQHERLLKLRDVIVDWDSVPAILQISATTEGDQNIDRFADSGITSKRTAEGAMEWQQSPKRMAHTVDGLLEVD